MSTFINIFQRAATCLPSTAQRHLKKQQQQHSATTSRGAAIVLAITKPKYASGQEQQQQQDQCPFKSRCRRWKQRRTRGALSVQRILINIRKRQAAHNSNNNNNVEWVQQQLNCKLVAQIFVARVKEREGERASQLIVKSGHDDNKNSLAKMKTKLRAAQKKRTAASGQ